MIFIKKNSVIKQLPHQVISGSSLAKRVVASISSCGFTGAVLDQAIADFAEAHIDLTA